jgi:GGDEF domain-containing protein
VLENRLIVSNDYQHYADPLPGFLEDGIRATMAAPVRQGEHAVGSLTVATRRHGRVYSPSEQEVLIAFAEHVGLALNDAQAVDALHRAVVEATHQSMHDSPDGAPEPRLFLSRLTAAAERSARNDGAPYALLFIDLDDFKVVNDSLGHLVGDQLLTAVAERVSGCLRPVDTVARLGGRRVRRAARGQHPLRQPRRPPSACSTPCSRPSSCPRPSGAGQRQRRRGDDDRPAGLGRGAAAGRGRGDVPGQGGRQAPLRDVRAGHARPAQARSALESELQQAVASGQFVVHYQPVVDAASGAVVSTEALVRWEHPRRGLVPPAEFLPLAEDTGLIVDIGSTVLHEACRQTASWRTRPDLHDLTVSVNLSPRQLEEDGLVADVRRRSRRPGCRPGAGPGDHRELLVGDAERPRPAGRAQGARRAAGRRRLRHGLLVAVLPEPPAGRHPEGGPVLRRGHRDGGPAGTLAYAIIALADSMSLETVAEGRRDAGAVAGAGRLRAAPGCRATCSRGPVPRRCCPGVAAALQDRLAMVADASPAHPASRRSADRR